MKIPSFLINICIAMGLISDSNSVQILGEIEKKSFKFKFDIIPDLSVNSRGKIEPSTVLQ